MMDFQSFWQRRGILNFLLLPLSWLFTAAAALRRRALLAQPQAPSLPPIVVVGNIVVGGGGKTPIVIALAQALVARGWNPGIISRGYGGTLSDSDTALVDGDSDWRECGDEPLLIARRTRLPVCVGKNRVQAAQRLGDAGCDVLISDDGLQHYVLPRQVEICVTDAHYRFGNGWRLPAGPLREGVARADQCDFHLLSGGEKDEDGRVAVPRRSGGIYPLVSPQQYCDAAFFADKTVAALAGIARPQSFFSTLEKAGITPSKKHPLPDHAVADVKNMDADVVLMTEKDAVKYPPDNPRLYALAMECELPEAVIQGVERRLNA